MAVSKKAKSSYDSEETPRHTVHWSVLLFIQIISPFLIGSIIFWWKICLETYILSRSRPVKKKKGSRLSEDEKAELLTNTERKKRRKTQNISHYVIGFLRYLQEKLTFAVKPCREVGKTVWKRRSKLAENLKIFYLNILNFWRIRLIPVSVRIINL